MYWFLYDKDLRHERIKPILIHECQHKSTRINTSPTPINTSPTWINRSPIGINMKQHESTQISTSPTQVNTSQLDQEIVVLVGKV